MCETAIEYTSADKISSVSSTTQLDKGSKDGLNWTVTYSHQLAMLSKLTDCAFLTWNFEWAKLQKQGIDGFSGYIVVKYTNERSIRAPLKFDVEFCNVEQQVTRRIGPTDDVKYNDKFSNCYITFELFLKPYRLSTRNLPIDQAFLHSSFTDAILLVEGRKMHVNKTYLSIHSNYFQALFSANFMEKSMAEIPIGDVRYEEFARLLAIISTKPVFPTDETVETLLILAERFLMPSIVDHVANYLLTATHFDFFQVLAIADKYKLKSLSEKCIEMLTALGQISRNRDSSEYINLTRDTKSKILDHLVQIA